MCDRHARSNRQRADTAAAAAAGGAGREQRAAHALPPLVTPPCRCRGKVTPTTGVNSGARGRGAPGTRVRPGRVTRRPAMDDGFAALAWVTRAELRVSSASGLCDRTSCALRTRASPHARIATRLTRNAPCITTSTMHAWRPTTRVTYACTLGFPPKHIHLTMRRSHTHTHTHPLTQSTHTPAAS
jgi:hypothetical protein